MIKVPVFFCLLFSVSALCQTAYYKGEWTTVNGTSHYEALIKLVIKDNIVKGDIYWTYRSCDSSKTSLVAFMQNKKGKSAIEFIEGNFAPAHNDIYAEGTLTHDPALIIGQDKYFLKLSGNMQIIYGKSDAGGTGNGLLYGLKIPDAEAEKEIQVLKQKIGS